MDIDDTFYARLGVTETADTAIIDAAFKALMKAHHPDRATDEADRLAREERCKALGEAHATLHDASDRRRYDDELAYNRAVAAEQAAASAGPAADPYADRYAEPSWPGGHTGGTWPPDADHYEQSRAAYHADLDAAADSLFASASRPRTSPAAATGSALRSIPAGIRARTVRMFGEPDGELTAPTLKARAAAAAVGALIAVVSLVAHGPSGPHAWLNGLAVNPLRLTPVALPTLELSVLAAVVAAGVGLAVGATAGAAAYVRARRYPQPGKATVALVVAAAIGAALADAAVVAVAVVAVLALGVAVAGTTAVIIYKVLR